MRAARHAKRSSTTFPRLSGDPVVQYLIEEAVFERMHFDEIRNRSRDIPTTTMTEPDPSMAAAQAFAEGRT